MIDRRIRPPLLTPATIVSREGKFTVAVQGVDLSVEPSRAKATTRLCREAIARAETLVVHVVDGPHRAWVTVTPDGRVSPSSPPAAGTLRANLTPAPSTEDVVAASTTDWVEDNILNAPPPPATPRKRFGLRRRA